MESADSMSSNTCVSTKDAGAEAARAGVQGSVRRAASKQGTVLDKFREIENGLDLEDSEESDPGHKRRRNKWSNRSFEFNHVSAKTYQEDLDEIFGAARPAKRSSADLKKNDAVSCILHGKKYKGTVFQTSFKGIVIKTRDRKKIRLLWEEIDNNNVQIARSKSAD